MKEGKGGDHLSVAVKLPGRSRPRQISKEDVYVKPPGKFLSKALLYYTVLGAAPFTVLERLEQCSGIICNGVHTLFWNSA